MRVGVLALQGAFAEHIHRLTALGAECFQIRQPRDLQSGLDALVLPGGESTVMGKLLQDLELMAPLRAAVQAGTPTLGTCAGLILLAKRVEAGTQPGLAVMDITAKRNAYGRQLGSFTTTAPFAGHPVPMVFIRAPYIAAAAPGVETLAEVDSRTVAARQGNVLATAFHPELASDPFVYEYFLGMLPRQKKFSA